MLKFAASMAKEFNGKYALVTGAASGMGRIYALRLSDMGYGLILADINEDALDSLCDSISDVPVVQVCIDLARRDAAAELARIAAANDASVEILINNAGIIFTSRICDTPSDKLGLMMDLHCTTPLLICREFVPKMKEAGYGYVLNISSICAWTSACSISFLVILFSILPISLSRAVIFFSMAVFSDSRAAISPTRESICF